MIHSILLYSDTALLSNPSFNYISGIILTGAAVYFISYLLLYFFDKYDIGRAVTNYVKQKWDMLKHGNAVLLVKDGVLQLDKLYAENITTQQVYAALRSSDINNLNEVERLFLIPDGQFTIYKKQEPAPGLPLFQYAEKELSGTRGEI